MDHTPGPWKIVTRNANRVFHKIAIQPSTSIGFGLSNTSPVASVIWYGDLGLANARLIAAAPDLFALLEEISKKDPHVASSMEYVVAKAKAAIDKVRHNVGGEAPAPA